LLEKRLASLEDGHDAIAFATGMAAAMALMHVLPPASHIIATQDAYFGVLVQFQDLGPRMGHTVTLVDTSSVDTIADHWRDNTRLLWLESPSNPQMKITDLAAASAIAREHNAISCCDNTVASSLWQHPLALGCDFSMHSATKYFGGHSDVMGGVLIARDDTPWLANLRHVQATAGATPSAFDCWLLLRSLATFSLRVRHQTQTATVLAERLAAHPAVERVLYPGDHAHPQRALIEQQMSGSGALLSFLVRGDVEATLAVARGTRLIQQATSLGGVESLIEHRHSVEGEHTRSPDNLLRLSVGVEDVDDLADDLLGALDRAVT
ncbi:MAG: aminotransferase class V-fold PLP-dependent enzyme, partial [Pseudomonadota bacterium]